MENPKNSKKVISDFIKENKIVTESQIETDVLKLCLKGGWKAYNSNNIPEAKHLCVQLQRFLGGRKPDDEEQKFIDTIKKLTEEENKS